MSFLDNLENTLNTEERRAERDPEQLKREREERDREAASARAAEPHARQLRDGEFTRELFTEARTIGHRQRVLIRFTWIGDTLRLEAGPRRVDLVPGATGVEACYFEGGGPTGAEPLDLATASAAEFAARWLRATV